MALAARRALDSGTSLGSLEALLRVRFETRHPAAVNTIVAAARQPVTLESLIAGFATVGPLLTTGGPKEPLLDAAQRNFSRLIVVRKKGEPSPASSETVETIARLVQSGRVEEAVIEAARMPGAANASKWVVEARRYVEARRALDQIERSAINMPVEAAPPALVPAPVPPAANSPAAVPPVPQSRCSSRATGWASTF